MDAEGGTMRKEGGSEEGLEVRGCGNGDEYDLSILYVCMNVP